MSAKLLIVLPIFLHMAIQFPSRIRYLDADISDNYIQGTEIELTSPKPRSYAIEGGGSNVNTVTAPCTSS